MHYLEIFESHEQPQSISMRAVKDVYQSCIDQKKMDLVGARPMIEKIQVGSFPQILILFRRKVFLRKSESHKNIF